MTKIRVHELAKELGVDNKDLMEALKKKDVDVKSHMSSLEDHVVAELKKEFGKPQNKEQSEEKKEETPKKKTFMQVFRPQNAKNSGRGASNRPAGTRTGAGRVTTRPAAGTNTASAEKPKKNVTVNAEQSNRSQTTGENRMQNGNTGNTVRSQENRNQENRNQENRSQENRSQGNRPQGNGTVRRNNDRNGDGQGRRNSNGNRYQNDNQGRRDGNRYQNDGQGRRNQDGERGSRQPRGERGDRGNSQYGGNRPQGRQGGHRDDRDAIPAPMVEQQKTQRNKGKDKEKDYKKKELREGEFEK